MDREAAITPSGGPPAPIWVEDDQLDLSLPIEGLGFERNLVADIQGPPGWFTTKLLSSDGPLVSDFVTHEAGFHYNTYGIHVGQVDRLTFMGTTNEPITGYLVDCRSGSRTLHQRVAITYRPSLRRRLVIPRGVAHTFDNVAGIVTRDEPVWYADFDNIDWDVNNDLVSVARSETSETFPVVKANHLRMPDDVHRFVSRLSQSLLETPVAYASRHLLTIDGKDVYVSFQSKRWTDDQGEIERLLNVGSVPGVVVTRSRYAITGPKSWTLVPNTSACVADLLVLPARDAGAADADIKDRFLHRRTRKWYTFLSSPGTEVLLDVVDFRAGSRSYGAPRTLRLTADPRVSLAIDPGIAYAISSPVDLIVRSEHEVFVANDEPRNDLPHFGQDLIVVPDGERPRTDPVLPTLRLPDEIVCAMARTEQEVVREAQMAHA